MIAIGYFQGPSLVRDHARDLFDFAYDSLFGVNEDGEIGTVGTLGSLPTLTWELVPDAAGVVKQVAPTAIDVVVNIAYQASDGEITVKDLMEATGAVAGSIIGGVVGTAASLGTPAALVTTPAGSIAGGYLGEKYMAALYDYFATQPLTTQPNGTPATTTYNVLSDGTIEVSHHSHRGYVNTPNGPTDRMVSDHVMLDPTTGEIIGTAQTESLVPSFRDAVEFISRGNQHRGPGDGVWTGRFPTADEPVQDRQELVRSIVSQTAAHNALQQEDVYADRILLEAAGQIERSRKDDEADEQINGEADENQGDVDPTEETDPILLDLDGNGISVTELAQSTHFVDGGDGLKHRTAWAAGGDGVLFYDVSGDGEISEKREYVFTDWDPSATSDLEAWQAFRSASGRRNPATPCAGVDILVPVSRTLIHSRATRLCPIESQGRIQ